MLIKGPTGEIEAQWDRVADAKGNAILCHPHPQFGGSMDDGVVNLASSALGQHGFNCLRFNFRGVGQSTGEFDQGMGEVDDLMAVILWLATELPGQKLWLMGYSFGANIVWRSLTQLSTEQVAGVLLVAPPVGRMVFPQHTTLPCQVFALAGDQDDFVDQQSFGAWPGINTTVIAGADHFFTGTSANLTAAVKNIMENMATEGPESDSL